MDTHDKLYTNHSYNLNEKQTNSHKHLVRALYTLVSKHSFDSISVKDICKEAGVSRSNFYNHFEDKYHLLLFYLKTLHLDLQSKLDFTETHMIFDEFLIHIYTHREFFRSLISYQNGSELRRLLESSLYENIKNFLWKKTTLADQQTESSLTVHAVFLTGGISCTIQWWVLNDFPTSLQEMSQMINKFVTH
ncbi:TetR/AcrR family transcriptional regulator [Enterococcus sp. AZ072]|uniref:TetR/AcrR family transcriptional regulator n=1 Tax=unclassified Enterococcus TaxID=2608891 RepID=UPI003D28B417